MPIAVIAGLGNPGSKYRNTRHNIGYTIVDQLAKKYDATWRDEARFEAEVAVVQHDERKLMLLKPQTFMNNSGLPIADIARFYKIDPSNVFVFHDELDLAVGKVRVKVGGGPGGHNGLRDLDRHLGLAYWRVRIGIGRPQHEAMDVKAWVLADFDRDEQSGWVPDLLDAITDEINRLYQHDDTGFMSRVAHLAPPPST